MRTRAPFPAPRADVMIRSAFGRQPLLRPGGLGAATAPVLAGIAEAENIDMPIVAAVHRLLAGEAPAGKVVEDLLSRPLRAEQEPGA